jgi:putative transposase
MSVGGIVYHALNRANARLPIFNSDGDYQAFLRVLAATHEIVPMRLVSYCLMPNHWHLVLWPLGDGQLSKFMHQMETTHAKRWAAAHGVVGFGHLYQGRFKNFPVQDDRHYLTVCRYVERNSLRANLVGRAEDWPWSSLHQRHFKMTEGRPPLSEGPMALPDDWLAVVNCGQTEKEESAIRGCILRGRPFGDDSWVEQAARRLKLESTLRSVGRPRTRR